MNWDIDPVPLWMAGDGPKMLELAGRIADGVVVGNGATVELVEFAGSHIAIGAKPPGRSIDDLEIWYLVPTHGPSRAAGIEHLRFYLASYAKVRFRYGMETKGAPISPELGERIRAFLTEYRPENQFRTDVEDTNQLLDKYDLTDWLADQRLITGSVDDVLAGLRKPLRAGATNVVMSQMLPNVLDTTAALRPVVKATRMW